MLQTFKHILGNLSKPTKFALFAVVFFTAVALVLQFLYPQKPPAITQVLPQDTVGLFQTTTFTFSFATLIPVQMQQDIFYQITPPAQFQTTWAENQYQFILTPLQPLATNQNYTLTLVYKKTPFFTHTFKTSEFTNQEVMEQVTQQGKDDTEFSEAQQAIRREYSWYDSLPIETEEYTIVYDYRREEFRIRLKISQNSPAELINDLTQKALLNLETIGVNPVESGYYVVFLD